MGWYKTGTVSVQNGQTSVSATDTKFASNARVGDGFRGPDGEWYEIVNIASETVIGIYPAYQGTTVADSSTYMIAPLQGYNKESADRLRAITDSISGLDDEIAEAIRVAAEAKVSADAAKVSETNSKTSETNAIQSANNAAQSELSASNSATTSVNASVTSVNAKDQAVVARDEAVAAAGAIDGVISDQGAIDLSSGQYPAKPTTSSIWQVTVGGTVSGVTYIVGDILNYSKKTDQFYKSGSGGVTSVNTRTGAIVLTKSDVNLNNVDNTSDANKPVSTATQTALDSKLGKTEKAADSSLLNGQNAAFYTKVMVGATSTVGGSAGLVPAPAILGAKPKFFSDDGTYKEVASTGGQPVGSLVSWPMAEATLPAGHIPANGQLLPRATWPELWAIVAATATPDADWLATPGIQSRFSTGDGSTTFRMPDLNGKRTGGGLPALFLRGYGRNSADYPGNAQLDQFQGHSRIWRQPTVGTGGNYIFPTIAGTAGQAPSASTVSPIGEISTDGVNGTPRTGTETRPANVAVIWCFIGGTVATNPGTVDVTALAAQVASQASKIQNLEADNMVILYPGGSAQAAPSIGVNTRISVPNPFPAQQILVVIELYQGGIWGDPGWDGNSGTGSAAFGAKAGQVMPNDFIIIQTGTSGVYASGGTTGGLLGTSAVITGSPYRLKVYKFKGPLV